MNQSSSQLYSQKVLEHVRCPRNLGELKNPDGVATVGNPVCGDLMRFYLQVGKKGVGKKEEYIKRIKFQTLGCGAAIATSSILTSIVLGKTLEEAEKISRKTVAEALDGLPPIKMHCALLAADCLKKAIADYRRKLESK